MSISTASPQKWAAQGLGGLSKCLQPCPLCPWGGSIQEVEGVLG